MLVGNEVLDSFFASQSSAKSSAVAEGISRFVIRLSVLNHIFSWNCFLVGHLPSWHLDANTSQLKTSQTSWPRYQCCYLVCCKPQDEEPYPSPRDEDFDPTLSCNIQILFFVFWPPQKIQGSNAWCFCFVGCLAERTRRFWSCLVRKGEAAELKFIPLALQQWPRQSCLQREEKTNQQIIQ